MHYLEQSDQIHYDVFLKGLIEATVRQISADLHEPDRMLQHRLRSLEIFRETAFPAF
jgi:hypothetical protein